MNPSIRPFLGAQKLELRWSKPVLRAWRAYWWQTAGDVEVFATLFLLVVEPTQLKNTVDGWNPAPPGMYKTL